MYYNILSILASLSISVLLFSASMKIRFDMSEVLVLYLPAVVLMGAAIFANTLFPKFFIQRLKLASLFLLLASASVYSFMVGEFFHVEILQRILINCSLGFFIVLFPWNKKSTDQLLLLIVVFGCVLSLNTIMVYDALGERTGYDDAIREGYLNITLATAFGCLAALHRLIEKISILSVGAFALCWVGIALSLGRGSLIFCVLVSIIYTLTAFSLRLTTMGKFKKITLFVMLVSIAPLVFYQMMSVERTAQRMLVLFTDSESTAGLKGRFDVYESAFDKIQDAPVVGNGLGAYMGDAVSRIGYPHNIVLQYAVDAGALGLLILSIFLSTVFYLFYKAMRYGNPTTRNTTLACGALFLMMLLSYMKSHDAYRGLEMFILSALPLSAYLSSIVEHTARRRRMRRGRSRHAAGARSHR